MNIMQSRDCESPVSQKIGVSFVVPVYRSAHTISLLVDRVRLVADHLPHASELVLVDDGSPDESWNAMMAAQDRQPDFVVAVQLMRNSGQHNALMCGLRHSRGEIVVTLDDDLQNPPEETMKLLRKLDQESADVVYGVPLQRDDPAWRRICSQPIQLFIQHVLGLAGPVSAFRAIRRPVVDAILRYDLNFTFIDGLIGWCTQRISYERIEHHARLVGRSGYSLRRLFLHALNIATNFSLLPLQVASGVGLAASLIGLLAGAYYLLAALTSTIEVPGYASIIVAVMVLGGLQLLALGVIGEYVGRLHLNVNRKPQYTVRQVLGRTGPPADSSTRQQNLQFSPRGVPPTSTLGEMAFDEVPVAIPEGL